MGETQHSYSATFRQLRLPPAHGEAFRMLPNSLLYLNAAYLALPGFYTATSCFAACIRADCGPVAASSLRDAGRFGPLGNDCPARRLASHSRFACT